MNSITKDIQNDIDTLKKVCEYDPVALNSLERIKEFADCIKPVGYRFRILPKNMRDGYTRKHTAITPWVAEWDKNITNGDCATVEYETVYVMEPSKFPVKVPLKHARYRAFLQELEKALHHMSIAIGIFQQIPGSEHRVPWVHYYQKLVRRFLSLTDTYRTLKRRHRV